MSDGQKPQVYPDLPPQYSAGIDPPPQYTPPATSTGGGGPKPYPTQPVSEKSPQPIPGVQLPVAVFNQDAAIDPNKPINIPPPPPGYAPTAAQQAAAQGRPVNVTQEKKDMLGGGSDGGVTIW